jgi:hypothetical protein
MNEEADVVTIDGLFELAVKGCAVSGCDHATHSSKVYVAAKCHLGARLSVELDAATRLIRIRCADCKRDVLRVDCSPAPST